MDYPEKMDKIKKESGGEQGGGAGNVNVGRGKSRQKMKM